jgi:DNA-binding transcriptional MerR regulator
MRRRAWCPASSATGGGRPVYTEHHVGWLEFMDRLRGTGMSVAQMRAYTALVKKGGAALGASRLAPGTGRACSASRAGPRR